MLVVGSFRILSQEMVTMRRTIRRRTGELWRRRLRLVLSIDDTLYFVACFVEFVGQRSRDTFVQQKRHLHNYDSGKSSRPVTIPGSSSAAS
jgi:hypothetical protein